MKFVAFKSLYRDDTGEVYDKEKVLINPNSIICLNPSHYGGTAIHLTRGTIEVAESMDEVLKRLLLK